MFDTSFKSSSHRCVIGTLANRRVGGDDDGVVGVRRETSDFIRVDRSIHDNRLRERDWVCGDGVSYNHSIWISGRKPRDRESS